MEDEVNVLREAAYRIMSKAGIYAIRDPKNPNEQGEFEKTPERFENFINTLLCRHTEDRPLMTTFESSNNEMITIGPVSFYSMCPHHLAMIWGEAFVGYVPNGRVFGLSKVPRLVRWMSGTLIKQEDLTDQIAAELEKALFGISGAPLDEIRQTGKHPDWGVAVVLRAKHACMMVRGVKVNSDCRVQTSKMTGCFLDGTKSARQEFLKLVL